MLRAIKKAYEAQCFAAVYSNKQTFSTFAVGQITGYTDLYLCMLCFSESGSFDGYYLIRIDRVFRIEVGSQYLNNIQTLNELNKEKVDEFLPSSKGDTLWGLFDYALKNNLVSAIQVGDDLNYDTIRGYVSSQSESTVSVKQLSINGELDGEVCLEKNDIYRIFVDDVECRNIDKLFKNRHQGNFC